MAFYVTCNPCVKQTNRFLLYTFQVIPKYIFKYDSRSESSSLPRLSAIKWRSESSSLPRLSAIKWRSESSSLPS